MAKKKIEKYKKLSRKKISINIPNLTRGRARNTLLSAEWEEFKEKAKKHNQFPYERLCILVRKDLKVGIEG